MNSPFSRAPHAMGVPVTRPEAQNAALLIDFDNVTMGMRSDLSKELKTLLNSDIIKGKVTVQRAYADWRRYPQYIVSLSENSVDLIYAPAYGSSKKNATDIRMAIDAIELVFIRPEIGTFILLTGDSDFSSLVLKLKEYGKYVIGVGIQESSSDILVQNCDEYYSYTSITGLRKTTDSEDKPVDPWVLVEQAVKKMASREDVMRSDRLKQVMMEIDPSFDEGNFGFSKFSRFLSDAASRDLVRLRKLENGQHEVFPVGEGRGAGGKDRHEETPKPEARDRPKRKGGTDRSRGGQAKPRKKEEPRPEGREAPQVGSRTGSTEGNPLQAGYLLLKEALGALGVEAGGSTRDSDLKRKMLELNPAFDEGELGFGKFSRFLRQAHDHEVVDLQKGEEGTYQVSSRKEGSAVSQDGPRAEEAIPTSTPDSTSYPTKGPTPISYPTPDPTPSLPSGGQEASQVGLRLRRGGTGHRKGQEGPPPFLEGQVVGAIRPQERMPEPSLFESVGEAEDDEKARNSTARTPRGNRGRSRSHPGVEVDEKKVPSGGQPIDAAALGLPTDAPALTRYLTNSYQGVGLKTAERLVKKFGVGLFQALQDQPDVIASVIPANRADQLLKAWQADFARRLERRSEGSDAPRPSSEKGTSSANRRTRKGPGGRGRGGGGSSS
jgi:uncharacterized protein (TIGR00288 family)